MFWIILAIVLLVTWKVKLPKVGLMCDPTGGVATLAIMGTAGAMQAYSQVQQGKATNSYYNYLAGQSILEGQAAKTRDQRQAELVQETAGIENKNLAIKSAEMSASQKAAMAASGVDLSSVTAQDLTLDTLTKAKMDEMMIRRNANLQSNQLIDAGNIADWEGNSQADQYRYAGKQAKKAANIQAFTTLLGTAASMGMDGYQMGMFGQTGKGLLTSGGSFSKTPFTAKTPSAYQVARF